MSLYTQRSNASLFTAIVLPICIAACTTDTTPAPGGRGGNGNPDATTVALDGSRRDASAVDSGHSVDAAPTDATSTDAGSADATAVDSGQTATDAGMVAMDAAAPADTGPAPCTYPAGAVEPMALNQVITPYAWPEAITDTGANFAFNLTQFFCNTHPTLDFGATDYLLFSSAPAW